jgi:hypothetical protein
MWVDNIKMDLGERERMGWCGVDLMAQDRDKWRALLKAVRNLQIPSDALDAENYLNK